MDRLIPWTGSGDVAGINTAGGATFQERFGYGGVEVALCLRGVLANPVLALEQWR
jgi:hypothetical protein